MKWRGREQSENIEDRRGMNGRKVAMGGGLLSIIILIIGLLMGGDPQQLLNNFNQGGTATNAPSGKYQETEEEKNLKTFASVTLADNEKV